MQTTHSKVALVTGASSGIGKAIAERLNKDGWVVWGTSRRLPSSGWPQDIKHVALDVTDLSSVQSCIKTVMHNSGRIDLVVNNAGVTLLGAIEETSDAEALGVLDTNLLGVHRVVREVLPYFRAQQSGRFICIGSIAGFLPKPFEAFYAAGKHAIEAYCESLDHEVRHLGIRSVLIEPEYVQTGLSAAAQRTTNRLEPYFKVMSQIEAGLQNEIAHGCKPEEVADIVAQVAAHDNPRLRYLVGRDAHTLRLFRTFLPERFFASQLRKRFGLS